MQGVGLGGFKGLGFRGPCSIVLQIKMFELLNCVSLQGPGEMQGKVICALICEIHDIGTG